MSRIRVEYYALLRERAGVNEETIETSAQTPAQLYAQLVERHGFDIDNTSASAHRRGARGILHAESAQSLRYRGQRGHASIRHAV